MASEAVSKVGTIASEVDIIAKFIVRQQEIRSKIKKGVLSHEERNFLRRVKAELKKQIRSIEQFETLLKEPLD